MPKIVANVCRYGVVRECEAISYQCTPPFFTCYKPLQPAETRMHYTGC